MKCHKVESLGVREVTAGGDAGELKRFQLPEGSFSSPKVTWTLIYVWNTGQQKEQSCCSVLGRSVTLRAAREKKIHQSHFLCIYVNTLSKVACTSEMILHDVMWHVTAMWNDLTWFDPIRHVRPNDTRQMIYDRIRHELLQYAVLPKDVCVFTKNADVVRDTKYCIGHIRRR